MHAWSWKKPSRMYRGPTGGRTALSARGNMGRQWWWGLIFFLKQGPENCVKGDVSLCGTKSVYEFLCPNYRVHPSMLEEEFSVVSIRHKEPCCLWTLFIFWVQMLPQWPACLVSLRTFCSPSEDYPPWSGESLQSRTEWTQSHCRRQMCLILKDFLDFNYSTFVEWKWPFSGCSKLFRKHYERWMLTSQLLRKSIYKCSEITMGLVIILMGESVRPSMIILQSSLSRERHTLTFCLFVCRFH